MYGIGANKKGRNINFGYQQQIDDNEKGYSSQREGKSEFHAIPARQFTTGADRNREREQSPGRLGGSGK